MNRPTRPDDGRAERKDKMAKGLNAQEVLNNVEDKIIALENWKENRGWTPKLNIDSVYEDLSIFDWWNDELSLSQLKQMRNFLKTAIKMGFTGYVCFKVGAKYCSHGMWAFKQESMDGHSPKGATLYHSFRSGDNFWSAAADNGEWMENFFATLKEVKQYLAQA